MAIDTKAIFAALESHAMASGRFERVNGHEPKNAPGTGISAALWMQRLRPLARRSGLAATSALQVANLRIYQNMLAEPQDAIDPNVMDAVDALMTAYSGDFTLGGLVAEVDLLGQYGTEMAAEAGYVPIDNKLFRVMTLTIPLVLNNVWSQSP